MQQKFNVGFVTFSYGGNGGISSEVPDIREWMTPLVVELSRDPRIDQIRVWNLADTPITMTRNRAVLQAREFGVDVLVMIDSDMKPDINAGQHPQLAVPPGYWQRARPVAREPALVSCVVVPGFDFADFVLDSPT